MESGKKPPKAHSKKRSRGTTQLPFIHIQAHECTLAHNACNLEESHLYCPAPSLLAVAVHHCGVVSHMRASQNADGRFWSIDTSTTAKKTAREACCHPLRATMPLPKWITLHYHNVFIKLSGTALCGPLLSSPAKLNELCQTC